MKRALLLLLVLVCALGAAVTISALNTTQAKAIAGTQTIIITITHNAPKVLTPPAPGQDDDTNGLHDLWEVQHFGQTGIDPNDDPDGDGLLNWQEFQAGTDPLKPHPGWVFFDLPDTLIPLSISPAGIALLRDETHYWRWHEAELTMLGEYNSPYDWDDLATTAVMNRSGDVAIKTEEYREEPASNYIDYTYFATDTLRIYPINGNPVWTYSPPVYTSVSDFTDSVIEGRWAHETEQHGTFDQMALAEDGALWGVKVSGIYAIDETDTGVWGTPLPHYEYFRYELARVPAGGGLAVTYHDDVGSFKGLDGSGRPIGLKYTSYPYFDALTEGFVGQEPVPYSPMTQSYAGRVVSYDYGAYALHEPDGADRSLPSSYGYTFDAQERLNGNASTGPYLLTPTGIDGAWRPIPYVNLPMPAGWVSNHKIGVGSESAQLGLVSINGGLQQPFIAIPTPAKLAVDANRDGEIKLTSEDDSDATTADKPYRFWVNSDNDQSAAEGDDIPEQAPIKADFNNATVDSVRDLVDFFPVYLDIKRLLTFLPHTVDGITYKLKQSEGALNFVYTNLTKDEARNYHKKLYSTGFGPQFNQAAGEATVQQITAEGVNLDTAFLSGINDSGWGVILVEGRSPTYKPLVLSVEKDGATIATVSLPINISEVEVMFRQVDLTGYAKEYNGNNITPPEPVVPTRTDSPPNWPDALTDDKYFVFVHGYNVDTQKARGWQSEIFKRLHVLGSKARFVGVTWHGATGLDYHKAVYHAFLTGDALKDELSFTGNSDVTVAAHSLGNMVVSHAIQSGGFTPSRYYMINAAVPIEAYSPDDVGPNEADLMTEVDWRDYDRRLFAANWHELFLNTDNRSSLTWVNVFSNVLPRAVNFYSSEEDVVADADDVTSASIIGTILRQGFNLSPGAWKAQELAKGVDWTGSLASLFMDRGQAGWRFRFNRDVENAAEDGPPYQLRNPEETGLIGPEELMTKPFFHSFLETDLLNPDVEVATNMAAEPKVRYDLLARAIPAMSNAAAANLLPSLGDRNFNMAEEGKSNLPIPTPEGGKWRHSDLKNVALPYVYKVYEKMITQGL